MPPPSASCRALHDALQFLDPRGPIRIPVGRRAESGVARQIVPPQHRAQACTTGRRGCGRGREPADGKEVRSSSKIQECSKTRTVFGMVATAVCLTALAACARDLLHRWISCCPCEKRRPTSSPPMLTFCRSMCPPPMPHSQAPRIFCSIGWWRSSRKLPSSARRWRPRGAPPRWRTLGDAGVDQRGKPVLGAAGRCAESPFHGLLVCIWLVNGAGEAVRPPLYPRAQRSSSMSASRACVSASSTSMSCTTWRTDVSSFMSPTSWPTG